MIKRHYILQSFLENESTTFQQNYLKKNFKYLTISTLLDPKEMDLAPCMDSENCELWILIREGTIKFRDFC